MVPNLSSSSAISLILSERILNSREKRRLEVHLLHSRTTTNHHGFRFGSHGGELVALAACGHELGCHGRTRPGVSYL
ncbi:hypothetical protein WN944_026540 [Citrus x changshan-huyou]|uniref:Uncharacterized protein n=1 Tax=Citrus x changshan-huyou TaxID=2935761 RepID=A0AAP0LUL4_9ROSI